MAGKAAREDEAAKEEFIPHGEPGDTVLANAIQPQQVANMAKEILNRSGDEPGNRSGASTPGFVRVAAEVADSAALLDKEDPEPLVSDEEAGKIGYRRLSSTPIPEVARTAAEVAETARELDKDTVGQALVSRPMIPILTLCWPSLSSNSSSVRPGTTI
jgi:hypothetical protein